MSKNPQDQRGPARVTLGSIGGGLVGKVIDLDDLVENTTDAVILIDREDRICFWNRGAERMFQWMRDEVIGEKVGFIVPADLREGGELQRLQDHIDQDGSIHNHITRRMRKDLGEIWVSLNRTALHDTDGHVIGSTATIRDISAHKRTEEELHRSRRLAMVGELAARVAHEIKNPLAGIYGALQLLARDLEPQDPRKEVFDDVGEEIRRLNETVQDLLRFARPVPPKPTPTDLRLFVLEVVDHLRHHPDVGRHAIEVDIEDGTVASIDRRLMGQVITNLALNAAQAMGDPSTIHISASKRGPRVAIQVTDSGPGIPPGQLNEVFDPFFTTKARGTGLGLSVARKNVEAHGGTIEVQNEELRGSRFVVTIPVA